VNAARGELARNGTPLRPVSARSKSNAACAACPSQCHCQCYFVMTPQAMRSPALPAGSDFMSSALA